MRVFDFDETIFTGDTEIRFFKHMFKKPGYRWNAIRFQWFNLLFRLKLMDKTTAREKEYAFLNKVPDIDAALKEYWDLHEKYMKPWYMASRQPEDVIATGTPAFLMVPICERLGLPLKNLVATDMDKHTGKINGKFAIGEDKVVEFEKLFKAEDMDEFYSDAWSDHFMAEKAKKAFIVHGKTDEITPWEEFFKAHPEKMK